MLDAKVINPDDRSELVKRDLETYAEVMNGFRDRYESTDSVLQSIERTVDYIKLNEPLRRPYHDSQITNRSSASSLQITEGTQARSSDAWAKLLDENPCSYLRISLTVEYSLSRGRLPSEKDFPEALQTIQRSHESSASYDSFNEIGVFYSLFDQAFEIG